MRPIVIHSVCLNGYTLAFPLYKHEHRSPELRLREVNTYGNNVSPGGSSSGLNTRFSAYRFWRTPLYRQRLLTSRLLLPPSSWLPIWTGAKNPRVEAPFFPGYQAVQITLVFRKALVKGSGRLRGRLDIIHAICKPPSWVRPLDCYRRTTRGSFLGVEPRGESLSVGGGGNGPQEGLGRFSVNLRKLSETSKQCVINDGQKVSTPHPAYYISLIAVNVLYCVRTYDNILLDKVNKIIGIQMSDSSDETCRWL